MCGKTALIPQHLESHDRGSHLRYGGLGSVGGLAVSQLVLPGCVQLLEVGHRAVLPTSPALRLKSFAALLSMAALSQLAL